MSGPAALPRAALIATTRASRDEFDALIAGLDDAQFTDTSFDGGRSAKDILAHVALWERLLCDAIDTSLRGETPVWPEPGATIGDVDAINEREFVAARARPPAEVRDASAASFGRAIRLIESLSEEQVSDPRAFAWVARRGVPLSVIVRANMDEHYDEHRDQIAAWLAAQR